MAHLIILMGCLFAVGCRAASDQSPYPDLTEPKAAAFSFAIALVKGDYRTARDVYRGSQDQFIRFLDTSQRAWDSGQRLGDLMSHKYGLEMIPVRTTQYIRLEDVDLPLCIAIAESKVSGDQAELSFSGGGRLIHLRRTEGKWRVTEMPDFSDGVLILEATIRAMDEVAKQIRGGQYAKPYEAYNAVNTITRQSLKEMLRK